MTEQSRWATLGVSCFPLILAHLALLTIALNTTDTDPDHIYIWLSSSFPPCHFRKTYPQWTTE